MLRVVLDANVYVSALLRPEGPPGRIIGRFLREADFAIVLTPAIVEEVLRAFAYPRVRKLLRTGAQPDLWLEDIAVLADLVMASVEISGVCADPDDDKYIAAAMDGRASMVVTGDRRFLMLIEHNDVRIVSPRAFLDLLEA